MAAMLDAVNIRTAFPIITCSCHQHQKQKKKKILFCDQSHRCLVSSANPLLLPATRPCITPDILILRFVTMNENMFLVNPASKLRIIEKKKTIMFSFLLLVSRESQQMRVLPQTSQLTSTLPSTTARKPRGVGIKEQMTYCSDDRPGVMASKKATFLFVRTLTLPTCALSG